MGTVYGDCACILWVIDQFAVPAPPTGPLFGVIFKVIQFVYQLLIVIELVIQTFVNNREKLGDPFSPSR
jgi:hypothetical protein